MKLKYAIPFFIIFYFYVPSLAQNNVSQKVLSNVNVLRESLGLKKLKYDNILEQAAQDQAYYITVNNNLTHFQKTFAKETPAERVGYYKGNRSYIGENVGMIHAINKTGLLSDEAIADSLFKGWLNSPPHYENMVNPEFTYMGLAYSRNNEHQIYAAQVFSSNEIHLPGGFKNADIAWGVRPAEFTCKDEKQTFETMFFANSVEVDGDSVYLYFHDLKFFQNVIKNDNDALAIDVVLREQFPCGQENQLHISEVYDGEMQRPIYKNDIYRFNSANNPKKIRVKIGVVPKYLRNKQWAANIIIINDNKLCDYSYPVEVPNDIFPLLEIKPYFELNDSLSDIKPRSVYISDSMDVEIMFDRSRNRFFAYDYEELERLAYWSPYISKINVSCFASVEGADWLNLKLLEERENNIVALLKENSLNLQNVEIKSEENWNMMKAQIDEHNLSNLSGKDHAQIKYFLKHKRNQFYDSLLFQQRISHIRAKVDTTLFLKSYADIEFAAQYNTLSMDGYPWNKILREQYILADKEIEISLIDSLESKTMYRTNLLGAASMGETNANMDSTLTERFIDPKKLDAKNAKQVFNYAHFLTKYWFSKFAYSYETVGVAPSITPNELKNLLNHIDSSEIKPEDFARIQINILLSGIHYYVAHNQWSATESYFNEIAELVKLNFFSAEEAKELALFCNTFHKFDIAVEILHPFSEANLLSEDGYFVLAQTATLIRQKLDQDVYHGYMQKAKNANHSRYCKWLDSSFQVQRDEYIKNDFCRECR